MPERSPEPSELTARASAKDNPALASVMERNIAALIERRRREEARVGWQARLAEAATRFTGNMIFTHFASVLVRLLVSDQHWACSVGSPMGSELRYSWHRRFGRSDLFVYLHPHQAKPHG